VNEWLQGPHRNHAGTVALGGEQESRAVAEPTMMPRRTRGRLRTPATGGPSVRRRVADRDGTRDASRAAIWLDAAPVRTVNRRTAQVDEIVVGPVESATAGEGATCSADGRSADHGLAPCEQAASDVIGIPSHDKRG